MKLSALTFASPLLIALFIASCSEQSDGPEVTAPQGKSIAFSATAPKGSRAAATTTATLQDFLVYAYTDT